MIKIKILIAMLFMSLSYLAQSKTFTSVRTGNWNEASTWDILKALDGTRGVKGTDYPGANDDVTIKSGYTVRLAGKGNERDNKCHDLIIEINAVLEAQTNQMALTINGSLNNAGVLAGNKGDFTFTGGAGTSINGYGIIKFDSPGGSPEGRFIIKGSTEILSTAEVIFYCYMDIDAGVEITNHGVALCYYEVTGGNAACTWTNDVNSYLIIADDFLITGVLNANANGNTVRYLSTNALNIITPSSNEYYNLYSADASTKTQQANLTILGDFTIKSGTYDCANYNIDLKGNYYNHGGSFLFGTGKFTFSGASLQTIEIVADATFYTLEINGGGIIFESNNVIAENELILSGGDVYSGANKLVLGTSSGDGTMSWTTGGVEGNLERFIHNTATAYFFPLGTVGNYDGASITIHTLTTSGSLIGNFTDDAPTNNGLLLLESGVTIYNTFMEGYWDFEAANGLSVSDYYIDIDAGDFTSGTFDADSRVLTRANSSSAWTLAGIHLAPDVSNKYAKRDNLTYFDAQFAVGDANNCTKPSTPVYTSPQTDVCSGSSSTYTVTNNSGTSYHWSVEPSSAGTVSSTTNTATVTWSSTGQTAKVICINDNGCTYSDKAIVDVQINSIAPKSITGKGVVAISSTETYSVAGLTGYTYTWTIVGGTQASGGTSSTISVNWGSTASMGSVSVVAQKTGCTAAPAVSMSVRIYEVINSNGLGGGDWNTASSWDCDCVPASTDNVRILSFDKITYTSSSDFTTANFIINSSAELVINTSADFSVNGNIDIDGLLKLGSGDLILPSGSVGTHIDGSGAIIMNGKTMQINNNRNFLNTALLTMDGDVTLGSGVTVSNYGGILIKGDVTGGTSFINSGGSILQLEKSIATPLTASALGNLVSYEGPLAQSIATPSSNTYYELDLSGNGVKTLGADLIIGGSMAILDHAQLLMNGSDMSVAIDWVDTSVTANSFIEGTSTITLKGNVPQYVFTPGGEQFYDLVLNNTSPSKGVILEPSSSITIEHELTFTDGVVDARTYGNTVAFNNGATANSSSSSSYIDGAVSKIGNSTFDFPIGDNIYYAPLSISAPSVTTDKFSAEYFFGSPHDATYDTTSHDATIKNISDNEYWMLERDNGASSVNVTLSWDARSGGVTDMSTLTIAHYDGGTWKDVGNGSTTGSTSIGTITSSVALSSFSPITLASKVLSDNPLPIDLLSFNAEANSDVVNLIWQTATETNNDYFTIERSIDGIRWETVLEKQGAGNSNQIIEYQGLDNSPYNGISYYRLKQTDFNGDFSYSMIRKVNFNADLVYDMKVYPNPTTGKLNLIGAADEINEVRVYNVIGQDVSELVHIKTLSGKNKELDLGEMPKGIYFIKTQTQMIKVYKN